MIKIAPKKNEIIWLYVIYDFIVKFGAIFDFKNSSIDNNPIEIDKLKWKML